MSFVNVPAPALIAWIQQQWQELLGAERVGPEDSFFELGGDSLAALQIVARLRQQGFDIELMDVFEHPALPEFAAFLATISAGAAEPQIDRPDVAPGDVAAPSELSLPGIVPAPERRFDPFPLTDMQEAYWMGRSGLLELGGVAGHNYREYECTGDIRRVERAWQRLVERHDMLRAILRPDGRQQVLREVPAYEIAHVDLSGRSAGEVEAILAECRASMTATSSPPDQWPPFEIRAFTLGDCRLRVHMRFEFMIYDAHTQRMLLREWARLCTDPDAPLPPLELTFRDYVLGLKQLEHHESYRRAQQYWLSRVPTLPPRPDVPLRRMSSDAPDIKGLRRSMQLARWLRLGKLAAEAGLTLSTVMCTAFADTLAAWSRDERFLITVMLLDRLPMHPQVNGIVGNFSSTVLLEVDPARGRTFAERARLLQEQLSRDLAYRYFPGGRVLRELNRARATPLAAASPFVFVSTLGVDRKFEGATFWKYIHGSLSTPQILVDMRVAESNGIPAFRCEYVNQCFPDGLIPDMFDAYMEHVERLADAPHAWQDTRRRMVRPADLEERRAANATGREIPDDHLHTMFLAQVASRAYAPAVVSADRTLTYAELRDLVHALSRRLIALGARPNQLIAIVMEKSWEQVVAAMAIVQAGAAYVPVNPALPEERRRYLLAQCEVRIVVTQPWLASTMTWPEGVEHCVVVSAAAEDHAALPDTTPHQRQDDLAYVIFTSGSTGLPKGVMMSHTGAVNTLVDINRRFAVGRGDRVLAVSALDFDLSVYDIFGLLGSGGTVVIPEGKRSKDPLHWAELLEREQVTVWNSVPALLELLVEYVTSANIRLPRSLRLILLSGDWIPVSLPDRVRSLLPDVEIISLGGATEAAVWSIYYPIERVDPAWSSIPYGKPLTNQCFHVLDSRMEDCPVWATGELYIGGAGVAMGYWRDEERTRERFVRHPRTGERLYRTGDLGRYLPDGNIEFLGRADTQVKVQGYRIELGEIEAVLTQHPDVRLAHVTVREDHGVPAQGRGRTGQGPEAKRGTHKQLLAYAVPAAGATLTEAELRAYLRQKLPEYMVPHHILMIDALPLSANGKVDRRALPAPTPAADPAGRDLVPPRNDVERKLAAIWSQLLDGRPVGVTQDFFELGGDSVLAVRLVARISRDFDRSLPVTMLFAHPTIESMAPLLAAEARTGERRSLVAMVPEGDLPPFYLIHPVGGNVLCYLELARRLGGRNRPIHALQSRGMDGAGPLLCSVEEMAAAYLDEVRHVQPRGPYLLGGWSMGGVIAFEMARQLEAAGHEVAPVVLIDAPVRTCEQGGELELLTWFARDLLSSTVTISATRLAELGSIEARLAYIVELAREAKVYIDIGMTRLTRLFEVFRTNARALAAYERKRYRGRLCMLAARDSQADTTGWHDLTDGEVYAVTLPGDHYTIFQEPHRSVLIDELGTILDARQDAPLAGHVGAAAESGAPEPMTERAAVDNIFLGAEQRVLVPAGR